MNLNEKTPKLEAIEQICDGWIKKYLLTYRMPNGGIHHYEAASRKDMEAFRNHLNRNSTGVKTMPDAVCIVTKTPRDTLLLIREFRYPLNSWCIAFPAGLIDFGETIEEAVARELAEETGYEIVPGTNIQLLPQAGYSSTGLTDETVQIAFVEAEKAGEPHTETNELIELFELPLNEVQHFLQTNKLPIGTRAQLVLEMISSQA